MEPSRRSVIMRVPITVLGLALPGLLLVIPVITGSVPERVTAPYLVGVLAVIAISAFALRTARAALLTKLLLLLVSASFTVTCLDLAFRSLLAPLLYYRPTERFSSRWPPMPLIGRYTPNVRYVGKTYGDLAAMSGHKEYREYREITFVTDSFGFRNDGEDVSKPSQDVDVILIGDSFGDGAGTTQQAIWTTMFSNVYRLKTYNLSLPSGSPWHELANAAIELNRLKVRKGTIVLWAIFTGNDLDEEYWPLGPTELPWNGPVGAFSVSLQSFRNRSPLRQLLNRVGQPSHTGLVVVREFIDGRKMLFYAPHVQGKDRAVDEIRRYPNLPLLEATIGAMVGLANSKKLTLAIVLIPSKEEVYSWVLDRGPPWSASGSPSGFSIVLREISDRKGISFLDLKPFLVDGSRKSFEKTGELLWWLDDTHWNSRGHEVAASVVYRHLLGPLTRGR